MKTTRLTVPVLAAALLGATALGTSPAFAFGEAGPLNLAQYGYFMINAQMIEFDGETGRLPNEETAAGDIAVGLSNQMFVEFMIPQEQRYPYPVVLVHGGGGQSTDWMATVDGRDGWINYLVNAGFAVYWVDRVGSGKSVPNSTYGNGNLGAPGGAGPIPRLATSANWPDAPMVYDADGNPDVAAWREANADNPTILAWAATSPRTPFASNQISGEAIGALLNRIGPAIVFPHSAGGTSAGIGAAIAAQSDNLVGILAFESGGASPYGNSIVSGSEWSGTVPDGGGDDANLVDTETMGVTCELQPAGDKSQNQTLAGTRHAYLESEFNGDLEGAVCLAAQARESGLEAIGVYMAEMPAGEGSGHFAMSELTSGDIANEILVPILAWISGEDLPEGFVAH